MMRAWRNILRTIRIGAGRGFLPGGVAADVSHNPDTLQNGLNPYTIEKKNLPLRAFGAVAVVTYIKKYRQTLDTSKFFNEDDTEVSTQDASGSHLRCTGIWVRHGDLCTGSRAVGE